MLLIGKVLRPQGIKGELKVAHYFDAPDDFVGVSSLYAEGKSYAVERVRVYGVESAEEVVSILDKYIDSYTDYHKGIVF